MVRWILTLIFCVSTSSLVFAQEAETTATPESQIALKEDKAETQDAKKESEIPLNLDAQKKADTEGGGAFRILFTLSILGLVGAGAYFFLRKYSVPKAMKHQTQIKILQQHYLGPKKSLAIVRVAGESILIGVTDHNISMIKSLSLLDEEIPEDSPHNFRRVLKSEDSEEGEKLSPPPSRKLDSDDEFAISGIKDIVSKRLKGMRSFQ
ncbi:MAG: flagellar biosynthetic protein FliO [Bdellovibrio sp.]